MSIRLAQAIVDFLDPQSKQSCFFKIEGIHQGLAEQISDCWGHGDVALRIGSEQQGNIRREHFIGSSTFTEARNRPLEDGHRGTCLISCIGFKASDDQGIAKYEDVSTSDLIASQRGLVCLCKAADPIDPDRDHLHVIRRAIIGLDPGHQPPAHAVSKFFDRIANNEHPLDALDEIGAFPDRQADDRRDLYNRLSNNFSLGRKDHASLLEKDYNEFVKTIDRLLRRRLQDDKSSIILIEAIQRGDRKLILRMLTYEEAMELFQGSGSLTLAQRVREDIEHYREELKEHEDPERRTHAQGLPWDGRLNDADQLENEEERYEPTERLLNFDQDENKDIFHVPIRKKLRNIIKQFDRVSTIPTVSSMGDLLVKGIAGLDTPLQHIRVMSPRDTDAIETSHDARNAISLGLMAMWSHLWLKELMDDEITIAASFRTSLQDRFSNGIEDALMAAAISGESDLPHVKFRVEGEGSDWIELQWQPTLDDLAIMRAAFEFSSSPAISIENNPTADGRTASIQDFCSGCVVSRTEIPESISAVASVIHDAAAGVIEHGIGVEALNILPERVIDFLQEQGRQLIPDACASLAAAGSFNSGPRDISLTAFSPLKAEWLNALHKEFGQLISTALRRNRSQGDRGEPTLDYEADAVQHSATSLADRRSNNYPAFLRTTTADKALFPMSEERIWSRYGERVTAMESRIAEDALQPLIKKIFELQPETATHFRVLAHGDAAASAVLSVAIKKLKKEVTLDRSALEGFIFERCEIICVDGYPSDRDLEEANEALELNDRFRLQLRRFENIEAAKEAMSINGQHIAHLAVLSDLSAGRNALQIYEDMRPLSQHPGEDDYLYADVLFTPKVSLKPGVARGLVLMPVKQSELMQLWLRATHVVIDMEWPEDKCRVPEVRGISKDHAQLLTDSHDTAMWVATVDKYVTRESIRRIMNDDVAILHQEQRVSGDSQVSIVVSQRRGDVADRAIARSLIASQLVPINADANNIAERLRHNTSHRHGWLALEATTSGFGVNELIGHAAAYSSLHEADSPWVLPEGCKIIPISLDQYHKWFPKSKRADLFAVAIDSNNKQVYVAAVEIKARRGDDTQVKEHARQQLKDTIEAVRFAAKGGPESLQRRIWCSRITEALLEIAKEIGTRFDCGDLEAIEHFLSHGAARWSATGLIFGPHIQADREDTVLENSEPPINMAISSIPLTREVITKATRTNHELRTTYANGLRESGGDAELPVEDNAESKLACWLLLEKSDETRISKGHNEYNDVTGEVYVYDSFVANHKIIKSGDIAIFRKDDAIIGKGIIGNIEISNIIKQHKRCCDCRSTEIRARASLTPKWKCGKCKSEFDNPLITDAQAESYTAAIIEYKPIDNFRDVKRVQSCSKSAEGIKSQHSMLQLDLDKLSGVLDVSDLLNVKIADRTNPPNKTPGDPIEQDTGKDGDGVDQAKSNSGSNEKSVQSEETSIAGELPTAVMGWDAATEEKVLWHPLGSDSPITNGHVEIWGASGCGKTQFIRSYLGQLVRKLDVKFGIADFKNDYFDSFPEELGAEKYDLWKDGLPYNPLALNSHSEKDIKAAVIELRDIIDVACKTFARLGHQQLDALRKAIETSMRIYKSEGRWPTLQVLHGHLTDNLRGVIGDLTGNPLFEQGPPLGDLVQNQSVFGLDNIPGTGLTTELTGAFIISAIVDRQLSNPPAPANTISFLLIVDEAHRVSKFKALQRGLREGRSKGLAVVLATQAPGDLPSAVATNAQTKICFQLDATSAKDAAYRLDGSDKALRRAIQKLEPGYAYVKFGNTQPRRVKMVQQWRDGYEF